MESATRTEATAAAADWESSSEAVAHPLEPCSAAELERAAAILKQGGELSDAAFFCSGALAEPPKSVVCSYAPGSPCERVVQLIGHDRKRGQSFEARVSLAAGAVERFAWAEEGQAPVSVADVLVVLQVLAGHEPWRAALAKRGIEDYSLVHVEPWVSGARPAGMAAKARAITAIAFLHEHPHDNHYARPVEGLLAHVDTDSGQVIVEDHGVVPMPPLPGEYAADRVSLRAPLSRLDISQPAGPGFAVDGHCIRWQGWQLRISVHPLEGLVLHDVRYDDGGRLRPILYRASLSDMVVPYGDPSPMHAWKHAFDASEAGMGATANSLALGCDCLGEIRYFDAPLLRPDGTVDVRKNAVCLHEEDYGILWKHTNAFLPSRPPEVRRSRRLVLSAIHTLGNYEYGFFWYFYLDGTIQMEIKLTGIVGVSAVANGNAADVAPLVAPATASPIHQHIFCFRLDFNVDGDANSVYEMDVEPMAANDPANPHGSGFRSVSRLLASEQQARRDIDPARSRSWRVVNPGVRNRLGAPVGYKLLPQASSTMLAAERSLHGRRAGFARHNLWVTPYSPDEMDAAAGFFSNLHPGGAGLPAYTAADRAIENADVVLWHSIGVTHVPRPEDWPVMPVEYAGFTLLPVGFFDCNPAIDVPPAHGKGHCAAD